jgi:hypothetical protein
MISVFPTEGDGGHEGPGDPVKKIDGIEVKTKILAV